MSQKFALSIYFFSFDQLFKGSEFFVIFLCAVSTTELLCQLGKIMRTHLWYTMITRQAGGFPLSGMIYPLDKEL